MEDMENGIEENPTGRKAKRRADKKSESFSVNRPGIRNSRIANPE